MPKITYQIVDHISKIKAQDWDVLFGNLPEGYAFYQALNNSCLEGFKFYYLLVYSGELLVLIAPLFCADFNLDIAVEGKGVKLIKFWRKIFPRFLITKTLFCGSPFSESGALGIHQDFKTHPQIFALLRSELESFAKRLGATLIIFKDFLKADTLILDSFKRQGYAKVESFPAVSVELNFKTFDDYLQSLGNSTRKNLKKKLKQAALKGEIGVKIVNDVRDLIDPIFKLYENTYRNGTTKFERLSREFFLQVSQDAPDSARYFLYYVNGRLAAFNLCFVYPDLLVDKFIGLDYDVAKEYNLYFVSWAYNIQWCIQNARHYYYPGQTDYELKIRLGGKLLKLFAYLKHRNKFYNYFFKILVAFLKPDNFDADLQK